MLFVIKSFENPVFDKNLPEAMSRLCSGVWDWMCLTVTLQGNERLNTRTAARPRLAPNNPSYFLGGQ